MLFIASLGRFVESTIGTFHSGMAQGFELEFRERRLIDSMNPDSLRQCIGRTF
jgi:hypothetical protein